MSVILPMCWPARNTHILAHRDWGDNNYSLAIDLTYDAFHTIKDDPSKYLSDEFMMSIYKPLYTKLSDLKDHLD